MSEPILSIQNLQVNYGGIEAVKGISFDVPEGEIVTLIGANGAGKSSTLRAISGLVKPKGGKILFRGEDITGKNPTEIVSRGITLVPEGRRIFADLTVKENLRVGAYLRKDDISEDMEWVFSLFPRLREREWQAGGTLSGGEQQMLAVGRALMSRPKVMMMDEPSLGLAPLVVREIFRIIEEVNKKGVTILLIEQNARIRPWAPLNASIFFSLRIFSKIRSPSCFILVTRNPPFIFTQKLLYSILSNNTI